MLSFTLLLVASLLHITTSTVYYVMPDDHYHPINDNTYILQHYLNNNNKYFTSNTQLHFLPGQYYLNNDLIIQGVSNFSFIGNRTNEVINTVINCTSPAGIAVVGSSNIVIANIVMNECGNDNFTIAHMSTYNSSLVALYVFYCKSFTLSYFYSIWHQKFSGIVVINTLNNELTNLISNFLLIWYVEINVTNVTDIHFIKKIQNCSTDTLLIKTFQAYYAINDIPTIYIGWLNTNFDFQATILNVNFTKEMALHVACSDCIGQGIITVDNCSFSSSVTHDYGNHKYDNRSRIHSCNGVIFHAKLFIEYVNKRTHNVGKIYFMINDCYFSNNSEKAMILRYVMISYNNNNPLIFISNCTFHNNKNTQLISAWTNCDKYDASKSCAFISIKNTTILHNTLDNAKLIDIQDMILSLEEVTIISNTISGTIVDAYNITCNKYNEFSKNSAFYVITAQAIYINENSTLKVTLNNLRFEFIYSIQALRDINMCTIQYISERGNLDKKFQMKKYINYSIIFNDNNMKEISNVNLEHCEWDPTSAFSTSSPLHVNRYFINSQHNNFKLHVYERKLCLCNENNSLDCYTEEMGPFYPGETVSFTLISIISGQWRN